MKEFLRECFKHFGEQRDLGLRQENHTKKRRLPCIHLITEHVHPTVLAHLYVEEHLCSNARNFCRSEKRICLINLNDECRMDHVRHSRITEMTPNSNGSQSPTALPLHRWHPRLYLAHRIDSSGDGGDGDKLYSSSISLLLGRVAFCYCSFLLIGRIWPRLGCELA